SVLAGSLFAIYSYILKFASGLDTIPYTLERLSALSDITRRIELQSDDFPQEPVQKQGALKILPRNTPVGISA
ncbi:MAG TPA: hypothetical protein PLT49_15130, partial [Ferruginibacter sp.]|nr:hypothetical protein [Ferruginibacter sp.]